MPETDPNNFDVIVIGGGPLGLSSAYHLSKRKVRTLVLEQFTYINQLGSSAGVSRQFRIPYPDAYMVKLVKQSMPYWDELQALTPVPLRDKVGTLWFGDPAVQSTEGNIKAAEAALREQDVSYVSLTQAELEQQYHFRNLPENYVGLFQEDGASIDLKATQTTLYDWNRDSPYVELRQEAPATRIRHVHGKYEVTTPQGVFVAEKLVLTPGPYADDVFALLDFGVAATYWSMASAFYRITDPAIRYPTWFVFQNPVGDNGNQFYGFPEVSWNYPGYVRVASDFVMAPLASPDQRTPVPNPRELDYTADWVGRHMTGLEPTPCYTSTCLVALSKIANKELLIDFAPPSVPNHRNVVICTTGWAGKFVPLIGAILADLALDGRTRFDISHFANGNQYFTSRRKSDQ
ncbi:FAD-dependent oxidoreductase [Massilia sp. Root335]|uniref:FAD-dependent oxidoreductase n=1 Tax=Massilia sp. Root335 TaxID=1736517 RepID=UPI0006FC1A2F|nr:FAD-dependent oxidoreductase [Massilia sp. Root335]KQV37886.1 FAD-dependent oxidoreductase [Massilia sp. Root335]